MSRNIYNKYISITYNKYISNTYMYINTCFTTSVKVYSQ